MRSNKTLSLISSTLVCHHSRDSLRTCFSPRVSLHRLQENLCFPVIRFLFGNSMRSTDDNLFSYIFTSNIQITRFTPGYDFDEQ